MVRLRVMTTAMLVLSVATIFVSGLQAESALHQSWDSLVFPGLPDSKSSCFSSSRSFSLLTRMPPQPSKTIVGPHAHTISAKMIS